MNESRKAPSSVAPKLESGRCNIRRGDQQAEFELIMMVGCNGLRTEAILTLALRAKWEVRRRGECCVGPGKSRAANEPVAARHLGI